MGPRHAFIGIDGQVDMQLVAAQRINTSSIVRGAVRPAEIPWRARMIDYHFAIQILQIVSGCGVAQANTCRTFCNASTNWSMSAVLLYKPSDARAVPGRPKRCITGMAQ